MKDSLRSTRILAFFLAIAILVFNACSALLVAQEKDGWQMRAFGWYAHFAGVVGVFGAVGVLRVSLSSRVKGFGCAGLIADVATSTHDQTVLLPPYARFDTAPGSTMYAVGARAG